LRDKDADTIRILVARVIDIRVDDTWAPEVHKTKIKGEKAKGLKAKAFLDALVEKIGPDVVVSIPPGDESLAPDFGKSSTLSRLVGSMWMADGREVRVVVINAGHAEQTKEDLLELLRKEQTP